MNRSLGIAIAAAFVFLAVSRPAAAHKPSDSYLRLVAGEGVMKGEWEGQWDVALRDLDYAIGIDGNDDGAVTWGEVKSARERIMAYAFARLTLHADASPCSIRPRELLIDEHSDGTYAVLRFAGVCGDASPARITVAYDLFADLDPRHRGLLRLDTVQGVRTAIRGPGQRDVTFEFVDPGLGGRFLHFVKEGIWHIWIGYDHILFLLALLLPAVLVRRDGRWHPEGSFRNVLLRILKIVTAFTIAHSITLSLAALGVVSIPARLIESLIAASVILSALNNIVPVMRERLWLAAFGFGLVHGFGFANVLLDLELPRSDLVMGLLGFNAGVELGQLTIVAAILPLIYLWRSSWTYARLALPAGSAATCAIASVWLVERTFDLSLPPL